MMTSSDTASTCLCLLLECLCGWGWFLLQEPAPHACKHLVCMCVRIRFPSLVLSKNCVNFQNKNLIQPRCCSVSAFLQDAAFGALEAVCDVLQGWVRIYLRDLRCDQNPSSTTTLHAASMYTDICNVYKFSAKNAPRNQFINSTATICVSEAKDSNSTLHVQTSAFSSIAQQSQAATACSQRARHVSAYLPAAPATHCLPPKLQKYSSTN